MLVLCHIMASMNMMWAETAEQHDMLSSRRLCKVYQLICWQGYFGVTTPPPHIQQSNVDLCQFHSSNRDLSLISAPSSLT